MARTITWKTKEKANKIKRPAGTQERKELVSLVVRSYFIHSLSNVAPLMLPACKS
jgi:hypothetical protein